MKEDAYEKAQELKKKIQYYKEKIADLKHIPLVSPEEGGTFTINLQGWTEFRATNGIIKALIDALIAERDALQKQFDEL